MAKVSVMIPTHNRWQLLSKAVASVVAQTMTDWELIISDDGSTDETPMVAHDLALSHDKVFLVRGETNQGVAWAIRRGMEAATAKRFAFLSDDDEYRPTYLETLLLDGSQDRGRRNPCCAASRCRPAARARCRRLQPHARDYRACALGPSGLCPARRLGGARACERRSELIADGSIHIYSTLRGRALAGLSGDPNARIFVQSLEAELISIGGLYRVADDIEPAARGKAAQIYREGDALRIRPLPNAAPAAKE